MVGGIVGVLETGGGGLRCVSVAVVVDGMVSGIGGRRVGDGGGGGAKVFLCCLDGDWDLLVACWRGE